MNTTDFPGYLADPPCRKRNAWSYIDARDLGEIVHLCLQKDGLGYQVFNAVNDTITATFRRPSSWRNTRPTRPSPADGRQGKRRCRTARSGESCWASARPHDWRNYVKT